MDSEIQKVIEAIKKVSLTSEEKFSIREKLLSSMKKDIDVESPYVKKSFWHIWSIHSRSFSFVAVLVFILGLSGGAVFGAQNSLPGDILYPIKTDINENIGRIFNSATPIAALNFETDIMQTRLEEAEMLDKKQELNDGRKQAVGTALAKQETRVQHALIELSIQNQEIATATSLDEGVEASSGSTATTSQNIRIKPKFSGKGSLVAPTSTLLATTTITVGEGEEGDEIKRIDSLISDHRQIIEKVQSVWLGGADDNEGN